MNKIFVALVILCTQIPTSKNLFGNSFKIHTLCLIVVNLATSIYLLGLFNFSIQAFDFTDSKTITVYNSTTYYENIIEITFKDNENNFGKIFLVKTYIDNLKLK